MALSRIYVRGLTKEDSESAKELCDFMDEYPEAGLSSIYGELIDNLFDLEKDMKSSHYFGVFTDNKLIGMCSLGGADPYYDEGSILSDVIINPEYQGRGYGTFLVKEVVDQAEDFPIFVDCLNNQQYFYERLGFIQDVEEKCTMFLKSNIHTIKRRKNKLCLRQECL